MNENHRRRVAGTFRHLDRLLSDALRALAATDAASPFSDIVPDATPVQCRVVEDELAQIRTLMKSALERLDVPLPAPQVGAVKAALTSLLFAEIDLEDLRPDRLRGYGVLDEESARALDAIASDLRRLLARTRRYLSSGAREDLGARLEALDAGLPATRLLKELERVITAHGLVDLRPALSLLVRAVEGGRFEVAIFGRVGSGKSSLLNRLLRRDLLPVGVTPITSVPTRIQYGASGRIEVSLADGRVVAPDLDRLAEFASEQGNPGNRKHVAEIVVQIPEERLRGDVVLVDTPGVGSLATAGAAESRAYLPRADLGIVLTDGTSSPGPEEVRIVDALRRSGADVLVLVSKADLLSAGDRERVRDYVARQIATEVGVDVPVEPVSVVGRDAALADAWFETSLLPRLADHRRERDAAIRRKVEILRRAAESALEQRRGRPAAAPAGPREREKAEWEVGQARRALERCRRRCDDLCAWDSSLVEALVERAASAIARGTRCGAAGEEGGGLLQRVLLDFASEVGGDLASCLTDLRDQMNRALETAGAEPTDLPEIRAMPVLGALPFASRLRLREPFWGFLGSVARRRSFSRQVRGLMLPVLAETLEFQRRRLAKWSQGYLDDLERAFEAEAGVRLGPAGGPSAEGEAWSAEARGAIERDLERLRNWGVEGVSAPIGPQGRPESNR